MSKNYKYTAADFERYHSGKMTEAEMHKLEKEALKDPFLADALEGYAYTDTPAKDIADIKEKLSAKRKKKNLFFLIPKQNIWLRAAALFVLIAGIGYLAYILNFNEETNTLTTKQNDIKMAADQIIAPKADSSLIEKDIVINTQPEKSEALMNKHDIPAAPKIRSAEDAVEKPSASLHDKNLQKSVRPVSSGVAELSREKNLMKGQIVDTRGNPIIYATIMDKDKKIITTSDSAGRFKLLTNDSSLTAVVSAPGFKAKEKKLGDNHEQVIVMENDSRHLDEVVVTASDIKSQKRKESSAPKSESKVPGIAVDRSTSEPVTGWLRFNEYIKSNINVPEDEEGKSYSGKVILSFEINVKGNPEKIKVQQSLCKPCDEEAKRLLLQGPKWKYINDKRSVIAIEF